MDEKKKTRVHVKIQAFKAQLPDGTWETRIIKNGVITERIPLDPEDYPEKRRSMLYQAGEDDQEDKTFGMKHAKKGGS